MNLTKAFVTLSFCLCMPALYAQKEIVQKKGIFSFGVTLADYNFIKHKDSSLHEGTNRNGLFKPGNASFGFQVSYWRNLFSHIDLSGNFGGEFSNFPAMFVKGDSIGQANFSVHLDGLAHVKAFTNDARVNPFLTAGIGAEYFGKQPALYTPLGAGVEFRFKTGGIIILQLQMRNALSAGITNNFMFYSISFAQDIPGNVKKHERHKNDVIKKTLSSGIEKNNTRSDVKVEKNLIEKNPVKNVPQALTIIKEKTIDPMPDTDGDGVMDKDDKCPGIKGSKENKGCPFPAVEGAEVLTMSQDSVTYNISFDFDRSELQNGAFAILNRIVEILQSDKALTINITGHADSQGTDYKNMQVSADRAKVTRDYFMSYNIAASRITSSYYGASRPIDKIQQWRNRRVEVTIIKK